LTALHDGVSWHGDFRVSKDGISLYPSFYDTTETIPVPDGPTIVREFLALKGYATSISSDGLALRRLLALTDYGLRFLIHPHLRSLLAAFDKHPVLKASTAATILGAETAGNSLRNLIEAHLLETGLVVQCDSCGGHFFVEIDALAPNLQCRRCQAETRLRLEAPKEATTWAYRLLPPFDERKRRNALLGMAAAMIAIEEMSFDITIAAGLVLEKSGETIEVDLVALERDRRFAEITPIFVEAKHRSEFGRKDCWQMSKLLDDYPYAVYGFTTMLDQADMNPHSLRRLRHFAQLRRGSDGLSRHQTLVLTLRELRPTFEQIGEVSDHLIGDARTIAAKTAGRYLSAEPGPYSAWRQTHARQAEAEKTWLHFGNKPTRKRH
jgi:hypothetical protein